MNSWKLLQRNLLFFRRTHIWVVLGVMTSTAILVGALIVGDSVRYSLQQIVFYRLGNTEFVLTSGDRFFRAQLSEDMYDILGTTVAPLLQTKGLTIAEGGRMRANDTQVLGVDYRFGEIGGAEDFYADIPDHEVIINAYLADHLSLREGDEFLLRFEKLDFMPKDAPLALDSESSIARRFTVRSVATDAEFGRFNLKADQIAPYTVFVSLSELAKIMGLTDKANVLLIAERTGDPLTIRTINNALREAWKIADAGLNLVDLEGNIDVELRSDRIFIDPAILDAANKIDVNAQPILTYFVNDIRGGNMSTPYSFVSAPGEPIVPLDMSDGEIIINDWLARDLRVNAGEEIHLTYYVLGSKRELITTGNTFRIRSVVPLRGIYNDRNLLPDFPGLADQKSCRDWEPGFPIDLSRIRKKDEDYWSMYGGTPKAFVTLNAAQKMWGNRFGNITAIRFPGAEKSGIENSLKDAIDPIDLGFVFREIREEGERASRDSVDFAQLFLGLSFFIIIAALLLTGLLFVFNVERRSEESGLLLALGFRKKYVMRLMLLEGTVLVILGSLMGCIVGIAYNQIILYALKTVWYGAVGTSALQIHVKVPTIIIGAFIGSVIALLTIWLVARKQSQQPISSLQKGSATLEIIWKKTPWVSTAIGLTCLVVAISILVLADAGRGQEAFVSFLAAGSLLLISGIAFANVLLFKIGQRTSASSMNLVTIGIRNNARRRLRSLTLLGLLASGLFIVFTVGANRKSILEDTDARSTGTGGFALYGESSIPILYDLNSSKGRRFYGLEQTDTANISYVQFRVKEGDDASCLNLNRVSNPQLIGINPEELAKRGSFTFVKTIEGVNRENPWLMLSQADSNNVIPAVADQTVIIWGLGKAVGDTLTYMDESGKMFKVRLVGGLANSIFQGNIIISEDAFILKYPSESGYRLFLIDAPRANLDEISRNISWALQDYGLDLIPASTRLAEFNKVENTYLSIFLILGSFGIILGSIGIGIVIWRNVFERRGELALFRAIGFSLKSLHTLVLSEHAVLLIAGILLGTVSASLSTLPSLLTPGTDIPYLTILFLLAIVIVNGFVWALLATFTATKGDLLPALRNE